MLQEENLSRSILSESQETTDPLRLLQAYLNEGNFDQAKLYGQL